MAKMNRVDSEARMNWRIFIADFLIDTADLERTKLEWSGQVFGVIRFYSEDVEMFLGDCLSNKDLHHAVAIGLLDQSEADLLQPFYLAFAAFADVAFEAKLKDEDIVVDPRWIEISRLAGEASRLLDVSLRS
ncbi:hypothetical protein [Bdellovibrio sp. HCB-162]|uniref:hypothetical protein n=1 Tax=Bdellovibrio sp. HCB-162 TaxID=3394234 RepID=UPI0039BC497A